MYYLYFVLSSLRRRERIPNISHQVGNSAYSCSFSLLVVGCWVVVGDIQRLFPVSTCLVF